MVHAMAIRGLGLAAAFGGVLLAGRAARGEGIGIELGVQYWRCELKLNMEANEAGVPGTNLSLASLDLDPTKDLFVPYVRLGGLYVDYLQNTYKGSTVLGGDMAFAGQPFAGGTYIDSSVKIQELSAYYVFNIVPPSAKSVSDFGPLFGLKYARYEGRIESDYASATTRLTAPVPVTGAQARIALADFLQLSTHIAWFQLSEPLFGVKTRLLEYHGDLAARYANGAAGIGYRYYKHDAKANAGDDDEIEFGVKQRGWYVFASLSF
jgi:hypothetical protein